MPSRGKPAASASIKLATLIVASSDSSISRKLRVRSAASIARDSCARCSLALMATRAWCQRSSARRRVSPSIEGISCRRIAETAPCHRTLSSPRVTTDRNASLSSVKKRPGDAPVNSPTNASNSRASHWIAALLDVSPIADAMADNACVRRESMSCSSGASCVRRLNPWRLPPGPSDDRTHMTDESPAPARSSLPRGGRPASGPTTSRRPDSPSRTEAATTW